jgi:hypothetical protein
LATAISRDELAVGARFVRHLPRFLHSPLGPEQARAIVRERLERRQSNLLTLVSSTIYRQPDNPYRQLLQLAGCEFGDLKRLVAEEGVEGALTHLHRAGVYLTVEEYKGRRPTVRGSVTLEVNPARLRNPGAAVHLPTRSGGSRGVGTLVPVDLRFVADRAVNLGIFLAARGGLGWQHANWRVPGSAAMVQLLEYSKCGARPVRWFSQLGLDAPGLHPRYRWSARAMRWGSVLAGRPLPFPCYAPLDDPAPITRWVRQVLRAGQTPHLSTFVSSAVRLCQAAERDGLDLTGTQFTVSGEPMTAARMESIKRAGATVLPQYGNVESGLLGYACLRPGALDEVHAHRDFHALIQPGSSGQTSDLPGQALFVTSLRPTTPLVMLNVSLGDQAVMEQRRCGCPLQDVGWTTHLHTIRSFEKLTAGGMTLWDTDVIRVLEQVLPARFGGAPTDYQLLEDEDDDGRPRLRLLVSPTVGPLDAPTVADAFLEAIGSRSAAEQVMVLHWRASGLLDLQRRAPLSTPTGKILHLHRARLS